MAIERIDLDSCTGCGECVKACPVDVIRLDKETKKAVIKYPQDCQVCCICLSYCPSGAIHVTNDKGDRPMTSWG